MTRPRPIAVAVLALLAPVGRPDRLSAQDPVKRVQFTGDLGFVNTSGNSEVTTFNAGDKLVVQTASQRHIFTQLFAFVYGRSEGETIASHWRGSGRYEYGLNTRLYLYALAGVERNTFAGISRRFEEGAGLRWRAVVAPKDALDLEAGASLNQQRTTEPVDENFAAGRAAAAYKHTFGGNAFFAQAAEFLPNLEDGDDYRFTSETALVAPLSARIAVKAAYQIRFDNTPPDGKRKTDRILTTGVQVTF